MPSRDGCTQTQLSVSERELVFRAGNALALAAADLPCENGCGCEDYDYCAQDEARSILTELDAAGIRFPP